MTNETTTNSPLKTHKLRDAFVLLFAMFFPLLFTWTYFVYGNGLNPAISKSVYAFGKILQFAFPAVFVGLVLKERVWVRKFNTRGLLVGGLFGLVVGVAIFALGRYGLTADGDLGGVFAKLREEFLSRGKTLGVMNRGLFLGVGIFYSIVHSGLEEYYWRWFTFGRVAKYLAPLPAAIVANLAFTLHHIVVLGAYFGYANWLTWFTSFGVFVGGCVWQSIYRKSDSVYGGWLSHGLIDAGIYAVGYCMLP